MTEGNDDGSVSSSHSSSSGGSSLVASIGGGNGSASTTVQNLVKVRAQVMMRDDSSGGWLPRGGGGLSNVSVVKRTVHHHHHHHHHPHHHHGSQQQAPAPPYHHHHHHHLHHHHHPLHHHHHQHEVKEFLIYGKMASDQSVVLNCSINKDFEYNKVMPTFHHWRSGEHKFGLTFQTAADARAFDKGVRQAVKELMDGLGDSSCLSSHSSSHPPPLPPVPPSTLPSLPSSLPSTLPSFPSRSHTPIYDDHSPPEEDVFVAVNLPVSNEEGGGGGGSLPACSTASPSSHLQRYRPARPPKAPALSDKPVEDGKEGDGGTTSGDQYSYVQFDRPPLARHLQQQLLPQGGSHEYYYPSMEVKKPDQERRDSIASIKKANQQQEAQQMGVASTVACGGEFFHLNRQSRPNSMMFRLGNFGSVVRRGGKSDGKKPFSGSKQLTNLEERAGLRQRCRHCDEMFHPKNNPRGSCEYAPDIVRSAIDHLTCIGCAQCMLYHCLNDKEGEYLRHPCTCSGGCCCCCCREADNITLDNEMMGMGIPAGGGGSNSNSMESTGGSGCGKRWLALTLLSLLVPCLCCYLPLKACHSAFVSCGVCGGRHESHSSTGRHRPGDSGKLGGGKHIEGGKFSHRGSRGRMSGGRFDAVGGS